MLDSLCNVSLKDLIIPFLSVETPIVATGGAVALLSVRVASKCDHHIGSGRGTMCPAFLLIKEGRKKDEIAQEICGMPAFGRLSSLQLVESWL